MAWRGIVLLRLAYLGVANVFPLLRLLPVSSRDKDAEILALRHQLSVLQRQLGPGRVRFSPARLRRAQAPHAFINWYRRAGAGSAAAAVGTP